MTDTKELLAERGKTHGDYSKQAAKACELRRAIATGDRTVALSDVQLDALNMICVKMSRIVCGNPNEPDHWRDIAGYATLVAERCVKPK